MKTRSLSALFAVSAALLCAPALAQTSQTQTSQTQSAQGKSAQGKSNVPPSLFQTGGKRGGTLTLPLVSSPQSFNYFAVLDNNSYTVMNNVLDRLITLDPLTNKLFPALAESWTFTPDGRSVTLKLRRGVKWSDGQDFSADDVLFTLVDVASNTGLKANQSAVFKVGKDPLTFSKVDAYTVKVTAPKPYGAMLQALTFVPILPQHKLAKYNPLNYPGGGPNVEFNILHAADSSTMPGIGTILQSDLAKLGVKVN
ncbi:ABC transporter substrate-binding protein [Deinococcus frigens]|uniref:ABC transporter substrate-binding protein n=1 Tax=Deinococcus frigens TaxID=249403 RepID=UPI0004977654|nr:ABC transporter substrate-binding protein [Deinococcus frigens]